jgi:hypothetical protein
MFEGSRGGMVASQTSYSMYLEAVGFLQYQSTSLFFVFRQASEISEGKEAISRLGTIDESRISPEAPQVVVLQGTVPIPLGTSNKPPSRMSDGGVYPNTWALVR